MRNKYILVLNAIFVTSLFACNLLADGTTYFSDGFESQSVPLSTPPIGVRWSDAGTGASYSITHTTSQVNSGSAALQTATPGGGVSLHLLAVGTPGALVAGNNIQFVIHVNQLTLSGDPNHNYNGPIQLGLGFSNGVTLAKLGTLDGNSQDYEATNAGTATDLGVKVPVNTTPYDTIRAVLHLTSPGTGMLGGTYDVYLSLDGGTEHQYAAGFALNSVTVPTSESTNPTIVFARGGSTSTSFYDDISIADAPVPEPTTLAASILIGGLLLKRRRTA